MLVAPKITSNGNTNGNFNIFLTFISDLDRSKFNKVEILGKEYC